jgi:hypothetical protein
MKRRIRMTKRTYLLLITGIMLLLLIAEQSTAETGTLEVVVTAESNDKPIEDAQVSFTSKKNGESFIIPTNERGVAKIDCIPGDYLMTNVSKDGYTSHKNDMLMIVQNSEVNHVDIYLTVAPKITGFVRDQTGKGIENASVQLVPHGPTDIVTDTYGKFEFTWDPRSIQLFLIARHTEHNLAGSMLFRTGIGGEEERYAKDMDINKIIVESGLTLTGYVVDPNSTGIPGAWVEAEILTGRGDSPIVKEKADQNGKYSINALPIGHRYYIRASRDGYGVAFKTLGEILTYKDSINVDTLILHEANQILAGTVVDANGNIAVGAEVRCWGEGQPERQTTTDSEGKFIIRNVCKGPLRIQALKDRMTNKTIEVEGGENNIRIVLGGPPMIYVSMPRFVTTEIPSPLTGKSLPQLDDIGIILNNSEVDQKNILICFFDMEQRPSRECILQINQKAQEFKTQGLEIIAIQASRINEDTFIDWVEGQNIFFRVGMITENEEVTRFNWGVKSLPWLILTDKNHVVTVEGFAINELDEKIEIPDQKNALQQ